MKCQFGLLTVIMLAACLGCGTGAPTTVKVSGKVQYNGQALTEGTITFLPMNEGGDFNRPAVGILDDDGNYHLSTFAPGDGAIPGKYQVTVVSDAKVPSPEEVAEKGAKVVSAIPAGYNNPSTSGLRATVEDSGAQTFDFDLKTGAVPDAAPAQGPAAGPKVDQFGT